MKDNIDPSKFLVICANPYGFFANFFHILRGLRLAEYKNKIPIIYWNGGIYHQENGKYNNIKSDNIWDFFFEPVSEFKLSDICNKIKHKNYCNIELDNPNIEIVRKTGNKSLENEPKDCWSTDAFPPNNCLYYMNEMSRKYVHSLVKKWIKLKPEVLEKVNIFYQKYLNGHNVLGVHIRSCKDNVVAQGNEPLKNYIKHISQYIEKNPSAIIFIATDRANTRDEIVSRFKDKVVYYKSNISQNDYLFSVHINKLRKRLKNNRSSVGASGAEEVLVEVLLLSKCNMFLQGASNVSAAVQFFNPNINSVFVPVYTKEHLEYLYADSNK